VRTARARSRLRRRRPAGACEGLGLPDTAAGAGAGSARRSGSRSRPRPWLPTNLELTDLERTDFHLAGAQSAHHRISTSRPPRSPPKPRPWPAPSQPSALCAVAEDVCRERSGWKNGFYLRKWRWRGRLSQPPDPAWPLGEYPSAGRLDRPLAADSARPAGAARTRHCPPSSTATVQVSALRPTGGRGRRAGRWPVAGGRIGGRIGAPGPGIQVRFRLPPPRRRVTPGRSYLTRYKAFGCGSSGVRPAPCVTWGFVPRLIV
jgi:hypothetical protein